MPPILEYALERQAKGYVSVAEPLKTPVIYSSGKTGTMPSRAGSGGGLGTDFEVAGGVQVVSLTRRVTHTLRGEGWDASEDGTGRGRPLVVCGKKKKASPSQALVYSLRVANRSSNGKGVGKVAYTLDRSGPCAVVYFVDDGKQRRYKAHTVSLRGNSAIGVAELGGGVMPSLLANPGTGNRPAILAKDVRRVLDALVIAVRYLMPIECERLQGIPDNYTHIPWRKGYAADGPRYKVIGNGMAVPCVAWVIKRLDLALTMRLRSP